VVAQAARLGFEPASPVRCVPSPELRSNKWKHTAWGCELEIVFVARGTPMLPDLWRFHQLAHSGCSAITYARTEHVPNNAVVMVGPSKWEIKDAVGRVKVAPIRNSAARFRDGLHACTRFA